MTSQKNQNRLPKNVPGKYFVTFHCTDCDLCREMAPEIFARNDEDGTSYIKKQPVDLQEENRCREAMSGCAVEAIQTTDGA